MSLRAVGFCSCGGSPGSFSVLPSSILFCSVLGDSKSPTNAAPGSRKSTRMCDPCPSRTKRERSRTKATRQPSFGLREADARTCRRTVSSFVQSRFGWHELNEQPPPKVGPHPEGCRSLKWRSIHNCGRRRGPLAPPRCSFGPREPGGPPDARIRRDRVDG